MERRLKIGYIAPEIVAVLFYQGEVRQNERMRVVGGVPTDSRVVSSAYCHSRDCFAIVFEHESFDPVEEGAEIPVVSPIIQVVQCGAQACESS